LLMQIKRFMVKANASECKWKKDNIVCDVPNCGLHFLTN
jgi:hypothetical protein